MADAERVRRIYARQAPGYDRTSNSRRMDAMRAMLFAKARGHVLEVGVGTGLTFPHYPRDLESLLAVDLSEDMLAQARPRAGTLPFPVEFRVLDAGTWEPPEGAFDTVTSSLCFCGIPEPLEVFRRLRRALKPGGKLLAMEHIRPPFPIGLVADLVDPICDRVVGCHFNRPTPRLLREAGFEVTVLSRAFAGVLVALECT